MFHGRRRRIPLLLALATAPLGCDNEDTKAEDAAPPAAATGSAGGDAAAEGPAEDDASANDEDKGTAVLQLGENETEWKAKRASARLKDNGSLRITASVYDQNDESAARRSLTLVIKDYKGVGEYTLNDMSSNLTAVKLDLEKVAAVDAAPDETAAQDAAQAAALDGMKGASVVLLQNAKVKITKAGEDFIDGSLSWSGVALNGPGTLSGTFHARVKE